MTPEDLETIRPVMNAFECATSFTTTQYAIDAIIRDTWNEAIEAAAALAQWSDVKANMRKLKR